MATSTMRNGSAAPTASPGPATGRGAGPMGSRFRPSGRARARLAVGVLLLVVGMLVSVAVYWPPGQSWAPSSSTCTVAGCSVATVRTMVL